MSRKYRDINLLRHHVNSFTDDNILDLAHLDETGDLTARGVAGGQLDAQGANEEEGLVVYFHKVDVKHHADEGDEYSAGQNSCVLRERKGFHIHVSLSFKFHLKSHYCKLKIVSNHPQSTITRMIWL